MTWMIAGGAVLLILILIILAIALNRSGRKHRDREAAYERYKAERKAALVSAEADQAARKQAESVSQQEEDVLRLPEAEISADETGEQPEADGDEDKSPVRGDEVSAGPEANSPDEEGSQEASSDDLTEDSEAECGKHEEPEAFRAEAPAEASDDISRDGAEPETVSGDEAAAQPFPPSEEQGQPLVRLMDGVKLSVGRNNPQDAEPGKSVSFISIGRNLFVRQGRRIIGSVERRVDAEAIAGWIHQGRPVLAVLSDREPVSVSAALYGSLLDVAMEMGLEAVKLHGTKSDEAQAVLSAAAPGIPCTAVRQSRKDKVDRWLVSCEAGFIGCLNLDEYQEGRAIVLARIEPGKKDASRLKPFVYIL